jgi:hypothetical protein
MRARRGVRWHLLSLAANWSPPGMGSVSAAQGVVSQQHRILECWRRAFARYVRREQTAKRGSGSARPLEWTVVHCAFPAQRADLIDGEQVTADV